MNERQRVTVRERERESSEKEKACKKEKGRKTLQRLLFLNPSSDGIYRFFLKRKKPVRLPQPSGHHFSSVCLLTHISSILHENQFIPQ